MSTLSRQQLKTIALASIVATSVYWPQTDIGQNVPADNAYTTMRVFNDRALAAGIYDTTGGTILPATSRDANGLPTTAFSIKVAEGHAGQFAYDPSVTGTWYVEYTGASQAVIDFVNGNSTVAVHTFSGGLGKVQFPYTAGGSALLPRFDRGVTSIKVYDPSTSATAIASGSAAVPRFNAQYLRTFFPYAYGRMMDMSGVNGDYVSASTTWPAVINWSDRATPANYNLNDIPDKLAGLPLEWQVELCNVAGKSGWFCISENASDDFITQFATYIAQNLSAGTWAAFELGNERWNTGGGFYCYHKAGLSALTECVGAMASTSGNRYLGTAQGVVSFSSNGTIATVVFAQAHGGTSGKTVKLYGTQSGYAGFAPTGQTITVVDSVTVTYPCTQASTGGTVTGLTVLGHSGFISLDASTQLIASGFIGSAFDLSYYWHIRRVFQMAALVRAAFTAVGRSLSDCKPLLALKAGDPYRFSNQHVDLFITAVFGVPMSSRLTAVAFGGYFGANQAVLNPGFGYTKSAKDSSQTTEAAVNTQMQQMVDSCIGAYNYTANIAWARAQGVEVWGYEVGMDLTTVAVVGSTGESTTTRAMKDAYQVDYATYGPNIKAMTLKWLRNLQSLGFSKFGWFQCGAGDQAGFGGFLLGQTPNEIDYTTVSSGQSPKFQGIIASLTPPTTAYAEHAFPCVLSGWDCVGNEAVVITAGVWPSLSGTNLPYNSSSYVGPSANGQTWRVWSEIARTATCTIVGDNTSTSGRSISVQPLGGTAASFTAPASTVAGTLGSCSITLQPGMNYVFINCATAPANIFPHTVQFSP